MRYGIQNRAIITPYLRHYAIDTAHFASAGVPPGTAIVVTLVYRFLSFWSPMPIGTFLYRQWLKSAPADVE